MNEILGRVTGYMCDQATGCFETVKLGGSLYNSEGQKITDKKAAKLMLNETVEAPNAGAGSYQSIFERLGFPKVEVYEQASSAGDWLFAVSEDGERWYPASQENRYPYHGFKYSINMLIGSFPSAQECYGD